ncbi:GNAT family N-acetyltransferase [Micromonospora sp. PLK6-60]|uniref:GNAT family N-acetyltransferase n=1 Tax=Micromonospora sp. PLK6-60 TaxID=2873383 RepID=UPI001CA658ED|nr:GNAT family N-acetyltransferase [Micromonospora sp. PLK6-60]MBY8872354.1 GNAT family N-acetyltransferase [Micromonospora sp. PLK6-60]
MTELRITPWGEDDLELLRRLNQPAVRAHTGGPETDEQVIARHGRYTRGIEDGQMFAIVLPDGVRAGSVGYWPRVWRDEPVYEMGWAVLPEFQGRGIATAAVRAAVEAARARGDRRWAHAYPSVDNPPSNAVCRKAGFELLGPVDFEYPPGRLMRSNDWRLDLFVR